MKTKIILPSAVCAAILGLAGAAQAQVTVPNPEGGFFHDVPQPIAAGSAVHLDVEGTGPWVDVTATFVGFKADDTDKLVLASINGTAETSPYSGTIFVNQGSGASSPDATVDLGSYSPGTELVFELEDVNSGKNWFSGSSSSSNVDGDDHFDVIPGGSTIGGGFGTSVTQPGGPTTEVGVEDATDFDYNDLIYTFTGVSASPVVPSVPTIPDTAGTMSLLGIALSGMAAFGRRFRK